MNVTVKEVLAFVKENEIKFIRLGFCDLAGVPKNISVMAEELPAAFERGVRIDAGAVRGFSGAAGNDLLLFPDPATLTILPWRPGPGRVARFYCDIRTPDGGAFLHDGRVLLKRAAARCEDMGYACRLGAACEFYLFETDDGAPTGVPLDQGGYLDIAPLDRGEDIRREICLTLEEMGIQPEASHHAQGPGQNEIDFRSGGALACADNLQTFKTVAQAVAARNGLYAGLARHPFKQAPGSELRVRLSLSKDGQNLFEDMEEGGQRFLAGVQLRLPGIASLLGPDGDACLRFGWLELRLPDPSANPYLALALLLNAGLDGIAQAEPGAFAQGVLGEEVLAAWLGL